MAKSVASTKRLQELDEKIKACIENISELFGGIENLDKDFEVLNTDDVNEEFFQILEKLVLLLPECLGVSQYLLPHLDEMRKQNGIGFNSQNLQILQVDENSNPDSTYIKCLWNNVCFYLEKYSFTNASENYIPLSSSIHNYFNLCQVRNYCVSMQSIFAPKDIWERYKNFRLKYLKKYVCGCKSDGCCYNCCLKLCMQCIYEDHLLCYLGCFHPHIVTQTNIIEIYNEITNEAFLKLLHLINNTIKPRVSLPKEIRNMLLNSKSNYEEQYRTCFFCFIQYSLHLENKSISYCIENNMDNVALWNKVFISSVLKLIKETSIYEDQINILFNLGNNVNFHSHSDDVSALFEGSKLILPTDSPEDSPFHESHHQETSKSGTSSTKMLFLWKWRLILVENGFITEIQRALQTEVEDMIKKSVEKEKRLLINGDWKSLINSEKKFNFSSSTIQTFTLLDSVQNTILVLEKYVPVLTCAVGAFQPFKYSFSHTLDTYVIDLLKHLEYLAEKENNIYFLYIATNNAIFLKDQLKYYCDIMEGPDQHQNGSCMNNVCRSSYKLADKMLESIFDLQFKYVCGIQFDSDSYNFNDTKPFFEGERISYSIQMWKMYMEGLHHDLMYFIPQKFAQELYGKILSLSLDRFLVRYSKSSASEARHPQILKDIYTILLCTSELIIPACSSVSQVMGKKEEFSESKIASIADRIHSNCCCLLSALVVLTSPISELHKVFKHGFPQPRLSVRSKYECLSPWLPWIRRELFSNSGKTQVLSNVSVWLAVKMCTTYTVPLPNAIIRAFTEHHCTLSILLMMQATSLDEENVTLYEKVEENKIKLAFSLSVLMLCWDDHSCLLDIFLPVIEKTNGWEEFDISSVNKALSERPWWYVGLYKALRPFLQSAFEEIVSFWFDLKSKMEDPIALKKWMDFKDEIKKFVVCVCPNDSLNSFNDNFSFSNEAISFLCVEKVLKKLSDNLIFLPQPIKYALICLDAHILNYMPEIQPSKSSVCLQFLLSSSITYLNEEEFVENLPVFIKDMPIVTSSALNAVCKDEDIFRHYKKEIQKLLSVIQEEFDSSCLGAESKSANFDEIKDDIINLTAINIDDAPKGIEAILFLHQVLHFNETWIQNNLGIPEMLSPDIVVSPISPSPLLISRFDSPRESLHNKELKLHSQALKAAVQKYSDAGTLNQGESFESEGSMEQTFTVSKGTLEMYELKSHNKNELNLLFDDISSPVFDFNPLNIFDKLGASSFTKVGMEIPSLPWEALLSHLPILGITEINFKVLFSQRWDVSNDVNLSAEEMRQIEELKSLYKYEE